MKRYLLSGILLFLLGSNPANAESRNRNQVQKFSLLNNQLEVDFQNSLNVRLKSFTEETKFSLASQNTVTNLPKNIQPEISETVEVGSYQRSANLLKGIAATDTSLDQVINVNQLRDVAPNDWAYEALRGLVDRYGCIAGFPEQTFRGNQALSRYEFAAGLNSCLQQIERLIAASEAVAQEDLDTVRRLNQEFETELATIAGRVDSLEGRVSFLEDNQFSTTTIFNGEVIFALADAFGGNPPGGCEEVQLNLQNGESSNIVNCGIRSDGVARSTADEPETNTSFVQLTRLGLETSFTGKDRLRTYLISGNFDNGGFTNASALNTNMARLSYQADLDNEVFLDLVEYRFPVLDDNVVISLTPYGFSLSDVLTSNSPYFDTGRGAISSFGQRSPIYGIGGVLDAGVGVDWQIFESLRLQVAYGAANSDDPDIGVFGSNHSSLGVQLLAQPTESVVTGLTYVNSYNSDGVLGTFTGSVNAETNGLWSGGRLPSSEGGGAYPGAGIELGDLPAQTNAFGGTLQWRITDRLTFAASGAYMMTNFLEEIPGFDLDGNINNEMVAGEKPFGNTVTYMFSLGLSDPFNREGDLFAFLFGMPPKLVDAGPKTPGQSVPFFEQAVRNTDPVPITDNDPRVFPTEDNDVGDPNNGNLRPEGTLEQFGQEDEATSLHFEFFYRFKVNDNIFITPGFFFVTNPGHIEDNDTLYVGTIRTTFRF
ncbi:Cyanobacterial porin [Hyella patelloides LEGE 07179]|uniref:Cyanobacterial porin n=1 Tax=Hyella patelloides LEGE 07179 TaxID=945734 RepID=A0A563VMH0_9CYAN|nr:iron uptake porin [Hyella patelloides]VEP12650.1 Cyanobacterial porin [Hyella patelloides LEGE 07179]